MRASTSPKRAMAERQSSINMPTRSSAPRRCTVTPRLSVRAAKNRSATL